MSQETKKKTVKVPRIVFDRPAFSFRRFVVCLGAALVLAFVLGWGLSRLMLVGASTGLEAFYHLAETWTFFWPVMVLGIISGVLIGATWKRGVTPRIEMVEVRPGAGTRLRRGSWRVNVESRGLLRT